MPKAQVIFFTSLDRETASLVSSYAPRELQVIIYPTVTPEEKKVKLVREADFLLLYPGHLSDTALKEAGRVRLIQLLSAGYDRINLKLAREMGIPVAHNGGANAVAVAEHTIMLILAVYRKLRLHLDSVKAGRWRSTEDTTPDTYEVEGKTVGIIGFGNIGREVTRRLRAFGAQIRYYDPYTTLTEAEEQELGARSATLEELQKTADVVSIHTPLSKETAHLIGAAELTMMKPSAIIVNTSRGGVIDQGALYTALTEGTIAGAGLDVLEEEPPDPGDSILRLENVIITPHMAGPTYDSFAKRARNAFANIQRVLEGEKPLWVARFA